MKNVHKNVGEENVVLERDGKIMQNENPVYYSCKECDFITRHKSALNSHKRSQHKKIDIFCDDCRFICKTEERMQQHKNRSISCSSCEYITCSNVNLGKHKREEHTKIVRLICDKCGFKAKTKGSIWTHKTRCKANNTNGKVKVQNPKSEVYEMISRMKQKNEEYISEEVSENSQTDQTKLGNDNVFEK